MPDVPRECDVLVVGAGPAGIAAACRAAQSGAKVVVLEQSPWVGGQIWRGAEGHPPTGPAGAWLARFARSGAQMVSGASVFASPAPGRLRAERGDELIEITGRKLVLATGARELFLPFPGWTLPGVIGPGGLHAMAKAGWPVAGRRVVVAGSGPLLLAVADSLRQLGARIACVAEQASLARVARFALGLWRHPGKISQAAAVRARLLGVPYRCGCWPVRAEGDTRVRSVTLSDGRRTWTEACDYLACGFHLVPNVELAALLGCEIRDGAVVVDTWQETTTAGVYCAGEPTGVGGAEAALVEGEIAGLAAAGRMEAARELLPHRARWHRFRAMMSETFALRDELHALPDPDTVVCRCEDVRHGALDAFGGWRAAKLQTRCGMGACQGRTCGAAVRFLRGWEAVSTRPPVFPASVGALAGAPMSADHDHDSTRPNQTNR